MRRRVLWAGVLYVGVVVAGVAWFVIHYGPTAGILAGAVGGLVGLLGLPAALRGALRLGGKPPESVPLDKVADGLALGVRRQWEAEVQVRRVNDPSPLPVAWTAADADLVESWSGLRELAENWPGGPPGDPAGWATGAWGLAGKGGEIDKVFSERVPTRRLVVLGEPGSGKTMLLIRLLLALLARRPEGGPVPVLFSLASWDPTRQDLDTWMAGQLTRDHPALRAPAPAELEQSSPGTRAHALLEQRLITPILDGLDELPPGLQVLALDALNGSLPARQPLVLSSRTTDYRNATATVRLHGAAGIRLLPLDSTSATVYLQRDADGPGAEAATRWSGIAASLGSDVPAAQALSTPLGVSLARVIYNPRPGEHPTHLAHPDEILDQTRFPTREHVEAHLFAAFVPAAYRPHPHHPSPWSAQQGQETLAFLARHLEYNLGGTPDLAWWHLHKALARHRLGLVAGLTSGLMFGLAFELAFGLALGLSGDLALGLTVGLIIGLIPAIASGYLSWAVAERMSKVDADPSAGIRWAPDWSRFKGLPLLILAGVFAGGLVAGGLHAGLQTAFVTVLVYGLIFAIENGLSSVPSDLATSVGPSAVLARDRRTFWTIGLTTWLLTGLVTGLGVGLAGGLVTGLGVGLWAGLLLGLLLALARSVWWKFVVARFVLAARGRVPWRLMGFLADAHERRGVLRQAGAVYQFRHLDLQRHLAERRP